MPFYLVAAPGIFIWGLYPRRSGGPSHSGVQGRSPSRRSGDEIPSRWSSLQTLFTDLSAETVKVWKFCTIYLLILDQCVSQWRLNDLSHTWRLRCCHSWKFVYSFLNNIDDKPSNQQTDVQTDRQTDKQR